jgi:hypothetical protein
MQALELVLTLQRSSKKLLTVSGLWFTLAFLSYFSLGFAETDDF